MRFTAHALTSTPLPLVPARSDRAWMDSTRERFAYRCTPLTLANSSGWEILSPLRFSVRWNGGRSQDAIKFDPLESDPALLKCVFSHFGDGIITFQTNYLFQTEPDWGTLVRGAPNWPKDGIVALEGFVETDWLPFSFTVNWMFTRPCNVIFEKGEPIAFVAPVQRTVLETIEPEIVPIQSNPKLLEEFTVWSKSREQFCQRLAKGDVQTVKQGWQKYYMRGQMPNGELAPESHRVRRRLAEPRNAIDLGSHPESPTLHEDGVACPHGHASLSSLERADVEETTHLIISVQQRDPSTG
jgi:hypothetical protein